MFFQEKNKNLFIFNSKMKKFIKSVVLFSIITIAICFVSVVVLYKIIDGGNYYKLASKKTNLIVGHSHTECAFNDTIIKNALNVANPGEDNFYIYFKVKEIVENNSIKNVFISFSNNQIERGIDDGIYTDRYLERSYSKYAANMDYASFMLLFKKNPLGMIKVQPIAFKKYLSYLLKSKTNIIEGNYWGKFNYLERSKLDSLLHVKVPKKEKITSLQYSITNLDYLDKTIKVCKANKVDVFLVRSPVHPTWPDLENEFYFQKILDSRYKTVTFLDFKDFPLEVKCYGDRSHLNHFGSTKFSLFFENLIENGLLKAKNKQEFIDESIKKIE